MYGRGADPSDAGRLVQRVPPVHRKLDDGDVDEADQRQDRPCLGAADGIVEGVYQGDVAEIEEKQHQHRGEPSVPYPPGAPTRLAPKGAGDKRDQGEAGADRRRRLGGEVGQGVFPDQGDHRGRGHEAVNGKRHPRRRDVDIHDAHALSLLVIGRRNPKRQIEPGDEQSRRRQGAPRQYPGGQSQEEVRVGEPVHR